MSNLRHVGLRRRTRPRLDSNFLFKVNKPLKMYQEDSVIYVTNGGSDFIRTNLRDD